MRTEGRVENWNLFVMDGIEKLRQLKAWFANLPDATPRMMKESFQEISSAVEDKVIEQLARGERGDGSKLPNYSPVSVRVFGKTPGPMNLHDRGPFWNGVILEVHDAGVEVVGRDSKTEMLQLRYGDDIIELQEGSKDDIEQEHLKPTLESKIENSIP